MLELTDWHVRRSGRSSIDSVSLRLRPGEVLGLSGPSGGGKTSLLLSLVGRVPSAGGMLRWGPEESSPERLVQRIGCAALFADELAGGDLSVTEWLDYHAAARGATAAEASAAAQRFGLTAWRDVPVAHLPSGLRERVLLARTELGAPALVLVDHPLSNLDAAGEYALAAWVDRLRDRRAVAIWASADRTRLEGHCDRVVLLKDGRVDRITGGVVEAAEVPS